MLRVRSIGWIAGLLLVLSGALWPAAAGAKLLRGSGHPPAPVTAVGPTLPIAHAGRWLTDASGRVVIVHGTNMVYKIAPYYPEAAGFGARDAAYLRSIGFNAVRVGVLWQGLEPQPGVFDLAYLEKIAQTVRTLSRYGILSVLDFHQDLLNQEFQGEGFPAWAIQTGGLPNPALGFDYAQEGDPALQHAYDAFFQDATGPDGIGLQEYYAAAWNKVAQRFRASTSVLGYEIMNEPFPGTAWETCLTTLGCPTVDGELTTLYNKVTTQIRLADPRTLVFYEPASVFNEGVNTTVGTVQGTNIGFAFHDYCLDASNTTACSTENTEVFRNALVRGQSTGQALLETEFGASDQTGYLESEAGEADANMIPWLEWDFCACGDPTTVNSSEGIIADPGQPASGANLITPTLTALVEPYPQVVAGTPEAYHYDYATHTFTFSYSTARAGGGGDFPAGSVTQIATPAFDYPAGYTLTVDGATVTSALGAGVLTIASAPGAGQVTVKITPPATG